VSAALGSAHAVWPPYTQLKTASPTLPVARTQGVRLFLDDGRVLIDGIASWWTSCHGYNHPHIRAAVQRQLETMPHVMFGGLTHEPAQTLAGRLAALLPGALNHVFFSDSGSVAVEVAMKMALQFWLNQGVSERTRFLAFTGGYHGDTLGAMALCDPGEGMHSRFTGLLPPQAALELPRDPATTAAFDQFLRREAAGLAAIIVEPRVQGAGGMIFHDPEILRKLRAACDEYGLLLIFDEIFTGFGRTGPMFACEAAGLAPDIITLSKALTGGTMGLAATIANARVFDAFWSDQSDKALMHGPTFMANPLACAAANASLDLFQSEPRLQQVEEIARGLESGLSRCRKLAGVADVRVMGAIGVVEFTRLNDPAALQRRCVEAGMWVRPFRNIVYLTPALTISAEDLGFLTDGLVRVLAA
jgi:adenosylmethionine-8-amino-7-oxononanoate aminotransferase